MSLELAPQPALLRSKNFLDLDDETQDEQRAKLELSSTSNQPADCSERYVNLKPDVEPKRESEPEEDLQRREQDRAQRCRCQCQCQSAGGCDLEAQLSLLRELLAAERKSNEQRRQNNGAMQKYLAQLQAEYLRLQRELVESLELAHKIKAQREARIETVTETLREREQLIEQLRAGLDESRLREEFKELMGKQADLIRLEKQQLREQVETVEQQLARERINNSQTLQQFQTRLDEQLNQHESACRTLRGRVTELEMELERLQNEPKELAIKALREEKSELSCQLDELRQLLNESQSRFDALRRRMETLLSEQSQQEQRNETEMERLQQQQAELRHQLQEARLELEDKEEVVQIVQFNLQRSEKRLKSVLAAMRGKEETYRSLVEQMQLKHEQELESSSSQVRSLERKLAETVSEMERKQNELVRCELEHENQLESVRNDRDQRLGRAALERQKVEKELQTAELKLARELKDKEHKSRLIEQLQKEVCQFREESKRLSIELTKSEAKLFGKQQELNQAQRDDTLAMRRQPEGAESGRLELEACRHRVIKLEETLSHFRADNERLRTKVRLSEASMSKMSSAINKEQAKMTMDYEKRLEQISQEQVIYDRNKARYKKYGYKLKRYCEHLRRVHEHLCNPTICGYLVGQRPAAPNSSTPMKLESAKLVSSDDETELGVAPVRPTSDRFSIKRTGASPAGKTQQQQRSILKSADRLNRPQQVEHSYYSINE